MASSFPRSVAVLSLASSTLLLTGCGSWWTTTFGGDGGQVRLQGMGTSPVALDGELPFGAYLSGEADHSMYLSDVPLEDLLKGGVRNGQMLHASLLWIPLPGRTPVDATATNVTIRYIVISEGEVGVYGGAGFGWPHGTPGEDSLSIDIQGSSLALLAKSEGFTDLLTPASLTGVITAPFNTEEARRFRRGVSQVVTDGLGVSRWVDQRSQPLSPQEVMALALPASSSSAAVTSDATAERRGS